MINILEKSSSHSAEVREREDTISNIESFFRTHQKKLESKDKKYTNLHEEAGELYTLLNQYGKLTVKTREGLHLLPTITLLVNTYRRLFDIDEYYLNTRGTVFREFNGHFAEENLKITSVTGMEFITGRINKGVKKSFPRLISAIGFTVESPEPYPYNHPWFYDMSNEQIEEEILQMPEDNKRNGVSQILIGKIWNYEIIRETLLAQTRKTMKVLGDFEKKPRQANVFLAVIKENSYNGHTSQNYFSPELGNIQVDGTLGTKILDEKQFFLAQLRNWISEGKSGRKDIIEAAANVGVDFQGHLASRSMAL